MIPAGSQITTGIGGRLIVHHAANQLSAGTSSRFILPGWEHGDVVRQTAGWLRYRIATASSATFGIETPFLDLAVDDAVLDVTVGDNGTEVAVVSGRVRVKSLDERRQIDLHAGYTGYASLHGEALAVRRGADQHLEALPPIVVPALHPDRGASATAAPGASGTATPAAAAAPTMVPRPAVAVSHPEEEGSAPATAAPAAPASTTPASARPDAASPCRHASKRHPSPPAGRASPLWRRPLWRRSAQNRPRPSRSKPSRPSRSGAASTA